MGVGGYFSLSRKKQIQKKNKKKIEKSRRDLPLLWLTPTGAYCVRCTPCYNEFYLTSDNCQRYVIHNGANVEYMYHMFKGLFNNYVTQVVHIRNFIG